MRPENLPIEIQAIWDSGQAPDALCTALMPLLCRFLESDRCFLYVRNPHIGQGRITHCYSRSSKYPDLTGSTWIEEGDAIAKDPLMAIAFRTPEAVFVEDIETAGEVVNLAYEQEGFGHRALIHAPIYQEGQLYGILEPCVFEHPRVWTARDRQITAFVQEKLSLIVHAFLE